MSEEVDCTCGSISSIWDITCPVHGSKATSRQASTATKTRPVTTVANIDMGPDVVLHGIIRSLPAWVDCSHKHAQRCLYTEGRWWNVCPECGYRWIGDGLKARQRHMFNIEAGEFDKPTV